MRSKITVRYEITEFCNKHNIEIPTTKKWGKSDTYVAMYKKYEDRELKSWTTIDANGEELKRGLWLYREEDLKEYFNV